MHPATLTRRALLGASAAAAASMLAPRVLAATRPQGFPDKPIRFIVPLGAGGVLDVLARHVADALRPSTGLTVVVENKPGAGGNIAAEYVAAAPPDGTTLLFGISAMLAGNSVLYKTLRYDALRSFVCLSQLSTIQVVLAVRSDLKLDDMAAFLRRATSTTDKPLNIASIGPGSQGHIAQAVLAKKHKAELTHVPYKGEPAIITDMLGGLIDSALLSAQACAEHVKSGKFRALAINGTVRNPVFPNVKTFAEVGLTDNFWSNSSPQAVFAPRAIDPTNARYLGEVISHTTETDKLREFLRSVGGLPLGVAYPEAQQRYESFAQNYREAVLLTGVTLD